MYSLIWYIECTRCGCFGSFPVILAIMDADMGCSEESFLYTTSMSLVPHNALVCILTLVRHWEYLQKISLRLIAGVTYEAPDGDFDLDSMSALK